MKEISIDVRGVSKVPALCKKYLEEHPRIAKEIDLKLVGNQQVDIVSWEDDIPIQFFEIKIGDDLISSLNTQQLHKEMREYSLLASKYKEKYGVRPVIYLICMGIYDHTIYARLIGTVSKNWNWVRIHMPFRTDTGIKKVFNLVRNPVPDEVVFFPTLVDSTEDKGFILSMQSLIKGVSVGLAQALVERWEGPDMTEDKVRKIVNWYYDDGRDRKSLSSKIYNTVKNTWYKK